MCLWKALLIVLNIHCQIQLQMGFDFPSPSLAYLDNVSLFLQGHLPLLQPLVCFLFILELCQEVLVHPCRLPAVFA